MLAAARRIIAHGYRRSPQENLAKLKYRLRRPPASPPAIRPSPAGPAPAPAPPTIPGIQVMPNLWEQPVFARLAAMRLGPAAGELVLLGNQAEANFLTPAFRAAGWALRFADWDWETATDPFAAQLPAAARLVLMKFPSTDAQWRALHALRARCGARLFGLHELLLPVTVLLKARSVLPYLTKRNLDDMTSVYLGQQFFGPIDRLDALFPLVGQRVIEFGPFEGFQTAGLVHFGAASVTCIEARADNYLKTSAARDVFGWSNVHLVMDDFHNATASRYGPFDLAFAHGVYYHSAAPFLFLENLLSLAPNVFVGGFCATETNPAGPFEQLEYAGQTYRVKKYTEGADFTAGINELGYYFHGDDLMRFFELRQCRVEVISDEPHAATAGRFLRFLARRLPAAA